MLHNKTLLLLFQKDEAQGKDKKKKSGGTI